MFVGLKTDIRDGDVGRLLSEKQMLFLAEKGMLGGDEKGLRMWRRGKEEKERKLVRNNYECEGKFFLADRFGLKYMEGTVLDTFFDPGYFG